MSSVRRMEKAKEDNEKIKGINALLTRPRSRRAKNSTTRP